MRRRTLKIDHLRPPTVSKNVVDSAQQRRADVERRRLLEEERRRAKRMLPQPTPTTRTVITPPPLTTDIRPHVIEALWEETPRQEDRIVKFRQTFPVTWQKSASETPDVSVVVPCYNTQAFFGTSLLTLLEQTHPISELIVVDDGSDVDFASIFGKSSRYHYVRQPHANGNVARNRGAALATGDFILFADSDCIYDRKMIETYLEALKKSPNAAYAYCDFRLTMIENGKSHLHRARSFDEVSIRTMNYISMISLIRRRAFPGFDENILRFQDWELWLSILKGGGRGVHVPKTLFTSISHSKCISRSSTDRSRVVSDIRSRYSSKNVPARRSSVFFNCNHIPGKNTVPHLGATKVSVVIPTYGNLPLVRECLDHLRDTQADFLQKIVVDNGIDDELTDFLYRQTDLLVLRNPCRETFARSVNRGFRLSSAAIFAVQRPEILVPSRFYERAFERFVRLPNPAALGAVHNLLGREWEEPLAQIPPFERGKNNLNSVAERNPDRGRSPFATTRGVDESCFLVSHDSFCRLGGLDETMDGVEMLDFSLRARNQGWVTYLDPSLFVFCSSKREVNLTEADFYFSNKHGKSIGALR